MNGLLGIVILNYNTWDESIKCITSIVDNYTGKKKIYLVDNCSTIQVSQSQLLEIVKFEEVVMINNVENRGYSAGNNIGIHKAIDDNCDYIMICNSDIIFIDNSLELMVKYIENNPRVGIVGPQIYDENFQLQPFYMLCELTGIGKLKNMCLHTPASNFFGNFERKFIRYDELTEPKKVFGVSGCCFLMSYECADYLYPLDERTFLYEEEYIIGERLKTTSFDTVIIPNTHVVHLHGVSTGGMSAFSYNCLIKSEQIYLKYYVKSNVLIRGIIYLIRIVCRRRYIK
jgi:hypothetical protein